MKAILAIELAWNKGFIYIWLECEFSLLCQAFSSFNLHSLVFEREMERECMRIYKEIKFEVSHIFHERNHCGDKLTSLYLENKLDFKWYDVLPYVIKLDFFL